MHRIDTIIFDLGGVLVDWNPEYLYGDIFNGNQTEMDWFLNNICTSDWNVQQDAGRTLKEATDLLVHQYPEQEELIRIYYDKWEKMIKGSIHETVNLLEKIKQANIYHLYALTNWSAETFPKAIELFDFLKHFEGIVVSGEEKTRKPFPKIYEIILDRYQIIPEKCVFIDDNLDNIKGAEKFGIHGIHFTSPTQLKNDLIQLGLLT